jgi:hypothetical protein
MFAIQKDHVEIKKTVGSLNDKLADGVMFSQDARLSPRNSNRPSEQYYNDEDFYMDDKLREKALTESTKQVNNSDRVKLETTNERLESTYFEQDESDLQELSYEDLNSIISEYLENEAVIDANYELKIDCSDSNHQTLLEILSNKILPKL